MTDTVKVLVNGTQLTLDSSQVQALVGINTTADLHDKVVIASKYGLPLETLPSFLKLRLQGYYPKTAMVSELGMGSEVEVFFKYNTSELDIIYYGPEDLYKAYSVKQIQDFYVNIGGDGFALLTKENINEDLTYD
jgi:hypothetical protein